MTEIADSRQDALVDNIVAGVRRRIADRRAVTATYRLQFTGAHFRFEHAAGIAEYLRELGVTHVYSSPILKSRAGSTHGYDVVDHSRLNDELGTLEDFTRYSTALKAIGLGQILDIVPNHMSVATDANHWWMDVLTNGPASPFAHFFDIDWHPAKRELEGKILLPVLGDLYGRTLESGQLPVRRDGGAFYVEYSGMRLPLCPESWSQILTPHLGSLIDRLGVEATSLLELQSILTGLEHLPGRQEIQSGRLAERRRESTVLQSRLQRLIDESSEVREHVERNLGIINGELGNASSYEALDCLLESQVYRLVLWKAGSDELNYRRFFDVTELAAVCTEHPDVYEATHRLPFELALNGDVDGFRIDHVDGLFDPTEYLWRLQWSYLRGLSQQQFASREISAFDWKLIEPRVLQRLRADIGGPDPRSLFEPGAGSGPADFTAGGPHSSLEKPLFVLVEKILGADEPLPSSWPIEGTTGYDFLNLLNGLFVDAHGLDQIERAYFRYVDQRDPLKDVIYRSKRLVLSVAMQSEVALLAYRLDRLSNRHRSTRDYTLQSLRTAIREIIANFPVYRTYIRSGRISERDRRVVQLAVALARRNNPALEASVLDFVRDVLLLEQPPHLDDAGREDRDFFVGRFQQVSSPVMAKGVEDTAFYRYVPLTSLEEVGGNPPRGVTAVSEFHRQNSARMAEWPQAMLATTTHDTKRSEDVRARLNVLSEILGEWQKAVSRWSRINKKFRRDIDGEPAPSRNDEWLFYQSLIGLWPLDPLTDATRNELVGRLQQYMEKATREAKLRTSWISPNSGYDEAIRSFVEETLAPSNSRFLNDLQSICDRIAKAGLYSALSQIVLKLTSPGIPDIYQGQELWDFSLVDPDNRRPVDYERRRTLLNGLLAQTTTADSASQLCRQLAANPRDDRTKLLATASLLRLRQKSPSLFRMGTYVPLEVSGSHAEHAVAFVRRMSSTPDDIFVVIVPRLLWGLTAGSTRPPCGREVWGDTTVQIENSPALRNLFTGATAPHCDGRLELATVFEHFPVAVLTGPSLHSA